MAVLPLKQTVTIQRKAETDRWGNEVGSPTKFFMKCRIEDGAKMTRRTSQQPGATQVLSEEVVSSAQMYFDKFADIRITDEIIYQDESGTTIRYFPININRIRGINGKTILTEVLV
ncbi:hypothetical protein [Cytobacillus firmus]|uniref:hypothetical protein n=1 Tax=Cytobacillus firmus TaxID=1399 RepID=UPI0018CCF70C|nr:hypothetical protein [Cytobacillus firmus]MBG9548518.1 hypothetical protein [Cytobacillus firmus]MBG9602941.1 hypothetical protein [Cytobacillus firmus]MBG9654874.1 hypothetical protein [Cytobacillus firmus]MED1906119.1 hypothetical protein [Cytobacillus firmus]MED1941534.1 hypothetical protein [Cytobacillus firmus]